MALTELRSIPSDILLFVQHVASLYCFFVIRDVSTKTAMTKIHILRLRLYGCNVKTLATTERID